MRKSWNGLISLVQLGMNLDPFEKGNFPLNLNQNLEITKKKIIWLLSGIYSRKKHKAIRFSK